MTYFDYSELNGRSLRWSMKHYNDVEKDIDYYNAHRGDGMCQMFFDKHNFDGDYYSFLESEYEGYIVPQMKYMNNAFRTKKDII